VTIWKPLVERKLFVLSEIETNRMVRVGSSLSTKRRISLFQTWPAKWRIRFSPHQWKPADHRDRERSRLDRPLFLSVCRDIDGSDNWPSWRRQRTELSYGVTKDCGEWTAGSAAWCGSERSMMGAVAANGFGLSTRTLAGGSILMFHVTTDWRSGFSLNETKAFRFSRVAWRLGMKN